ncbi:MAG: hypothetical protein Q4E57_06005 [Eubacteriales bacterium]|nr:hypothetical protein [Eubacteriales bacterium]
MGLTAERICGVCGKKINVVAAIYATPEMRDNCYLCSDCQRRCSPSLSYSTIRTWTREDALEHMRLITELQMKRNSEFKETDAVMGGSKGNDKILCGDAEHGWWYVPGNPDFFTFDQVEKWELNIRTSDEASGIHLLKYKAPRADMPVPDRTEDLTGMSLNIYLNNHPYAEKVTATIGGAAGLLEGRKKYMERMYGYAEECYKFFEKFCGRGTISFS